MQDDEDLGIYEDSGAGPDELGPSINDGDDEGSEMGGLEEVCDFLSDDALRELAGVKDLADVFSFEVRIDTEEITMRDLGTRLPNMVELKLNNSNIPCFRDLGTSFRNLQVLWLSRAGVKDLDGLSAFSGLRELYLSFNDITDISPVGGMDTLQVLDLEGNNISEIGELQWLQTCSALTSVSLESNPCADDPVYRSTVLELLPGLKYLDDLPASADGVDALLSADSRGAGATSAGADAGDVDDEHLGESAFGESPPPDPSEFIDVPMLDMKALLAKTRIPLGDFPDLEALTSPVKTERASVTEELSMVKKGIKYGRVGFDDVEFDDDAAVQEARGQKYRRPQSASFVPGQRPRTRDGTNGRPGSSPVRPGSAFSRPTTAFSGGRPKSSWSRPATAYGRGGKQDDGQDSNGVSGMSVVGSQSDSSDLTFGNDGVFCGNPVMALRGRKADAASSCADSDTVASTTDVDGSVASRHDSVTSDELFEELKRWKLETATMAIAPEPSRAEMAGMSMVPSGSTGTERLLIDGVHHLVIDADTAVLKKAEREAVAAASAGGGSGSTRPVTPRRIKRQPISTDSVSAPSGAALGAAVAGAAPMVPVRKTERSVIDVSEVTRNASKPLGHIATTSASSSSTVLAAKHHTVGGHDGAPSVATGASTLGGARRPLRPRPPSGQRQDAPPVPLSAIAP